MPFRGVTEEIECSGPAKRLLTAQDDDVDVQVSCVPYGATGVSGGPNFFVGGPDLDENGGFLVTSNEYMTTVSAGDEIWVKAYEELPFATTMTISATIRSVSPSHAEDAGEPEVTRPG